LADFAVYKGLFWVSFLAATILPAQSELGLAALIINDEHVLPLLILAAATGNTLGAVVNWWLGTRVETLKDRKWFPVKPAQLDKATAWYAKWGRWSLLMSWTPIIGDPLTLAAGVLKEPLWSFLILVAVAKTGRYLVVAALALSQA